MAGLTTPQSAEQKLWFAREEYYSRVSAVQARLARLGADAFVAFMPESVTYLTGFYSRGYASFQLAVVPQCGATVTVFRDVEAYHFEATSAFPDCVMWSDGDDPLAMAATVIGQVVGRDPKLAFEPGAWTLPLERGRRLTASLPRARWMDAGGLVADIRLIKSEAEIDYQRLAGKAAEAGMQAAIDTAQAGQSEREMAAAITAAMIRAGSDTPGPGVLSSGEAAWHLHGSYGDRVLRTGDTIQFEATPHVRHYHARFMRAIKVGSSTDEDHRTFEQLVDIQDRALAEVGPGRSVAIADQVYREGVVSTGLKETYTNKTFYSIGLMFPPRTAEELDATAGSSWSFETGMVFHTYIVARGFGLSETIAITFDGYERLTRFPRELVVA